MAEVKNRFDRIVSIFLLLLSGKILRSQDLADKFGVSQRTIFRDIRSLEGAGVPVMGEPGEGYSILDGYSLPPVMFTQEEATGFIAAQKLVEKYTDKGISEYYESAMLKIKSILRYHEKERLNILGSLIKMRNTRENHLVSKTLSTILKSISEQFQIKIIYEKSGFTGVTERYIEPAGLFNEMDYWYVLAYCHLRKEYRQFRTDRIKEISQTSLKFTRTHNYEEEFAKLNHEIPNPIEVVIKVRRSILPYIINSRKYYGFKDEELTPTHSIMRFITCDQSESFARWYLSIGDQAKIIKPENFKIQVENLMEKIWRNTVMNV